MDDKRMRLAKAFLQEAAKILSGEDKSMKQLDWDQRIDYWQRCFHHLRQEVAQRDQKQKRQLAK